MAVSEREVSKERTGWRDRRISERHRKWGWDCPVTDFDWLVLEYDKGEPVAIIEYKHENAPREFASHPTFQAIIKMGNYAKLPVFVVRYADDFSWWFVVPLNEHAKKWCPERIRMDEREWVTLLYRMRGYEAPMSVFSYMELEI